jgi:uncharacterized integral membrane protein
MLGDFYKQIPEEMDFQDTVGLEKLNKEKYMTKKKKNLVFSFIVVGILIVLIVIFK